MITDQQRQERSSYLGSSDAAGILGLSPYDTQLSVWCEKTGQYLKPEIETEAAELGKELENYVAKRFERKTGKKVIEAPHTFFHPEHPFLAANLDRIVEDEDAILEAKTCSAWKSKEWSEDQIPAHYMIQVYHQMMVTRKRKAYLCVLIGNQSFQIRELFWDDRIIKNMQDKEIAFWDDFVIPKVMPSVITWKDTDTLEGLFPVAAEGKTVALDDTANILIENLTAYKQDVKSVEQLIEGAENQLKALLGDAERGQTSLYSVGWKNMKVRRFDLKAFEAVHPDLAKEFKPEKIQRRFDFKSLIGETK